LAVSIKNKQPGVRQLTWLLAWAVVFCDIGTSVYYVPGILYNMVGNLAPLFVAAVSVGFVLLALKYAEMVRHAPTGGGVVAIAEMAFGERFGALAGMLIVVDFFLTAAISSVSGFYYLSSAFPSIGERIPLWASLGLITLAIVNIFGVRESARLSLVMACAALVTNLVVVGLLVVQLSLDQWAALWNVVSTTGHLGPTQMLTGFGAAWLAFSGLESLSQLAPAIREPVHRTAKVAMIAVIITILLTSPTLTVLSIGVLPDSIKAAHSERFISELAGIAGGGFLKATVVVTAAALLLFAANTAIIGTYHVFLSLAERQYFPRRLLLRNRVFGTPHNAVITATVVPLVVIVATHGRMELLGDMYAFGLLGAFVLGSGGLDVVRWRAHDRGVVFWIGILVTLMVMTAWGVNLVAKPMATAFGVTLTGVGMLYGLALREGWIKEAVHLIPSVGRRAREKALAGEAHASEVAPEIVSLAMAQELKQLYNSSTLVAVAGRNPPVIAEAIRRVKGMGENALYCIYVEEWPGLFYGNVDLEPSVVGVEALAMAARQAAAAEVELIPIWTTSYSLVEGVSRASRELGVNGVVVGLSRRTALYRLFRGQAIGKLSSKLAVDCRLIICD